jgi:citrate lyase beta subunit
MSGADFRSLLFVPGNRPDRFAKALGAGADAVCIDLEDAVAPEGKEAARAAAFGFLVHDRARGAALGLRMNGVRSLTGIRDLAGLGDCGALPDFLMVPKLSHPTEAAILADLFPGVPLWPIVETAQGLRHAWDIAAVPGVAGLLFGAVDFSAETGGSLSWESLAYARGALAAARAAAGIGLLDVPHLDIADTEDLAHSTRRARDLGFTGRACIHPAQVPIVNAAFSPTPGEIAQAERLVAALRAAGGSVVLLDGKLVEKPVILAAERVLARAAALSPHG